ncbi:hydroxyethylthiazole kinase [Selenomonas sp. oral taxon 126]|uniref:hydroxyethylthiazole kinase n=1 Tax=Selenomonas sp. oral taxon 126 TaxID=712528 RepID=UPI0008077275|nr:hydroxyethylthiazole kinase [Selenomonas sp. oral taxon 126]ANR69965.1 hydroxyethylthiazole kinase [Selenomonas sp. oral taxon 126]
MNTSILAEIRRKAPLIHCITNYVTVNDVANVLLAIGARPVMADDPAETEEITALAAGLCLNIGTLNARTIPSMLLAGVRARVLGHPVVLDPVGAGASVLRTETALRLLDEVRPTVIRGNISEIRTLAVGTGTTSGVDADAADAVTEENLAASADFLRAFAARTGALVAVTGAIDLVTDGRDCYVVRNGRAEMGRVTGTGCQLSALLAAALATAPDEALAAVTETVALMGVAGELAWSCMGAHEGNATYRTRIIDSIYCMTDEELAAHSRIKKL